MKRHSFKDKVKWVWVVLIGVLFLLQTTASAIAHPFIIDQDNISFLGGGNANAQEFTPTLDALDVVEVFIGPRDPDTVAVVNIRIGSITGPIIGTSLPTGPVPGSQIVHFDFPSTVPLVPGDLYVYEVSFLSGGGFAFVTGPNSYPGGRAIQFGVPQPDLDSSFRLGISSAEGETLTVVNDSVTEVSDGKDYAGHLTTLCSGPPPLADLLEVHGPVRAAAQDGGR